MISGATASTRSQLSRSSRSRCGARNLAECLQEPLTGDLAHAEGRGNGWDDEGRIGQR